MLIYRILMSIVFSPGCFVSCWKADYVMIQWAHSPVLDDCVPACSVAIDLSVLRVYKPRWWARWVWAFVTGKRWVCACFRSWAWSCVTAPCRYHSSSRISTWSVASRRRPTCHYSSSGCSASSPCCLWRALTSLKRYGRRTGVRWRYPTRRCSLDLSCAWRSASCVCSPSTTCVYVTSTSRSIRWRVRWR